MSATFATPVATILLAPPGQFSGHVLGLHRMDEHFRTTPVKKNERVGEPTPNIHTWLNQHLGFLFLQTTNNFGGGIKHRLPGYLW